MVSSPQTSPSEDSPPSSSSNSTSSSPSNSTSSSSSNSTSPSSSSSPPPPKSSPSPPPPPKSSSPPPSPPVSSSPPPPPPKSSSPPPPKQSSPPPPASTSKNNTNSPPHFHPPPPRSPSSPPLPPPPLPLPHVKNVSNLSPPPPNESDDSSSEPYSSPSKSESNDNSNVSIVAGVAVAVGVVLFIFVVILVVCLRKKKRTRYPKMQYYSEPKAGGDDPYYTGLMHRPWGEHGAEATPPPHGGLVSSGAWATPSTVPPPVASGAWGSPSTVPPSVASGAWGAPSTVPPPGAGGGRVSTSSPVPAPIMSGELSSLSSGAQHTPLPPPTPNIVPHGINTGTFTYEELSAATGGFSEANLLGQGGFGFVHKGVLPSGKEIAVKSLKSGSGQGEREFQAEVEIISRVHHRYLVSLVGYCMVRQQRMLVYEFLPNKTLEYHLHGKNHSVMYFSTRFRIALGSAKGLAYIHEDCHPRIIHRDIKSANILLDNNFEAKVADFGLARLSGDNCTHVSTRVMGTFGYLAPEYASSGKLTDKSDVYSFGVVLLELITGKQPMDPTNSMDDSLVDWARPQLARALEDGDLGTLVDPRLKNNYNHEEMKRMVACAAASVRHSARKRPRMSQIVRTLEGNSSLDDLEDVAKSEKSSVYSYGGAATDYSKSSYDAD